MAVITTTITIATIHPVDTGKPPKIYYATNIVAFFGILGNTLFWGIFYLPCVVYFKREKKQVGEPKRRKQHAADMGSDCYGHRVYLQSSRIFQLNICDCHCILPKKKSQDGLVVAVAFIFHTYCGVYFLSVSGCGHAQEKDV